MSQSLLFRGELSALSNLYHCTIEWQGDEFYSSEAIYQVEKLRFHLHTETSCKFSEEDVRHIAGMQSSKALMLRARRILPPRDQSQLWEEKKLHVMGEILQAKYAQGSFCSVKKMRYPHFCGVPTVYIIAPWLSCFMCCKMSSVAHQFYFLWSKTKGEGQTLFGRFTDLIFYPLRSHKRDKHTLA